MSEIKQRIEYVYQSALRLAEGVLIDAVKKIGPPSRAGGEGMAIALASFWASPRDVRKRFVRVQSLPLRMLRRQSIRRW